MHQQSRAALDRLQGWTRSRFDAVRAQFEGLPAKPANLTDIAQKLSSAVMEELRAVLTGLQAALSCSFARNNAFFNQEFPARFAVTPFTFPHILLLSF